MHVAFVQPQDNIYTETFLRAQARGISDQVTIVNAYSRRREPGLRGLLQTGSRAIDAVLSTMTGGGRQERIARYFTRLFRRVGAEVVLAQYGPVGVQVLEASRRCRLPLVVHFHGYDASVRSVLEAYKDGYLRLFRSASAIIAVSRPMRDRLIALGAPPDRVHLNPYGVDPEAFSGANPGSAAPILVAVGRLVAKKAPHLTIRAFSRVITAHPDARLRLMGDGPLLAECQELVAKLGIAHAVEFVGTATPFEVASAMRGARAFVQHSVEAPNGDCEGTPVAILEAASCGLPIVATRHAGIPDAVIEGTTGFLVDEGDVIGMAAGMERLIADPALAGQMGAAGRRHVLAHYQSKDRLAALTAILRASLEGGAAEVVRSTPAPWQTPVPAISHRGA